MASTLACKVKAAMPKIKHCKTFYDGNLLMFAINECSCLTNLSIQVLSLTVRPTQVKHFLNAPLLDKLWRPVSLN
jgi:hypothetical protein